MVIVSNMLTLNNATSDIRSARGPKLITGDGGRNADMAKILIIDDDAQIRRMLERALTGVGYEVVEAKDGDDGLKAFAKHRPELVVTDIVMPDREGLETIRELRRLAPHLPVIAISGSVPGAGAPLYLDFAGKL